MSPETGLVVRDSDGDQLSDGDTIMVIKDLKEKGSASVVKVGAKVKNIRLEEGDHDIDCKIAGAWSLRHQHQTQKWYGYDSFRLDRGA